ncbi:DUF349 domain-containing protein [Marinobacter pelagius]|uniref:DUF349 domain-containing protein n=1 Tax=Marinobacter pelagius TaxID=379482 RepID=A0A1I4XC71_9GAMM|nr:DUF349 domain-containing protein [Marinobacter pelagius]SFN23508.1 protein of unknown function [Marinobacter pelagius]
MAAFIQKLFKSRKSSETTGKPRKEVPEQSQVPQEDLRADQRESQLGLLKGSPSQEQLAKLALEGVTADIRLSAAKGLTDAEQLQKVQKQAKGRDKGVYQTVKQALQAHRQDVERQENVARTITTLINNAQEQARSEDTKLYQARLEALTNQWKELESQATAEQVQQFLEATHRCRERLQEMEAAREEEKRHGEQLRQREETLELLTSTLEDLKSQTGDSLPSLSSLDALQRTQENRWLEATRDTDVSRQEQKTYESAMLALRNYLSALRRLTQAREHIGELSAALDSDEAFTTEQQQQAKTLIREIDWPEGFPKPALLEPVRKLAGKRAEKPAEKEDQGDQKARVDNLKITLDKLESALEAKQFRESRQLLKTAQNQFRDLDRRHSKPFQARMQLLTGQFRELSDWQGFATEPKQIALCEQMEYLAEQPMEPEAKAERIKELQSEWRELGGSSDRALWTRFKSASDRAFEPCKAYFEAKSGLKQANLEKRQAICAELETFLENADWTTIDWKGAERIHQTARQEWKAAWPVEFRDNRPVQKRFDDLLKRLESPLDEERRKNEGLKQAIVERAEALIEHEPLQEAMNEAKALQSEWKAIGITRHREDRKLWQAFRKACDQIFARRDAQRDARQQASETADREATELLTQLAAVTPESSAEALRDALMKLRDVKGNALSQDVKERVQAAKGEFQRALDSKLLQQKVSQWQELASARGNGGVASSDLPDHWQALASTQAGLSDRELVIRAEILSGMESPAEDQQRRMEIQVQRLSEGMGNTEQAGDRLSELEKLVAQWCLQPSDETPETALSERLNSALSGITDQ